MLFLPSKSNETRGLYGIACPKWRGRSVRQQAQPLLNLAGVPHGLSEQDQIARPSHTLTRSQDGDQALVHLRHARHTLALHRQYPTLPECGMRHPLRKPLRRGQGQQGVGLHLDYLCLTAIGMEGDHLDAAVARL